MENESNSTNQPLAKSENLSEKPKTPKGAKIAITILAVLAIGGLGFGGYEFYQNQQHSQTSESVQPNDSVAGDTNQTEKPSSAQTESDTGDAEVLALLAEIQSALDDAFDRRWSYVTTYNHLLPYYNPNKDNLYILLNKSYGLYLKFNDSQSPRERTEIAETALETFFTNRNYSDDFENMAGMNYSNGEMSCFVEEGSSIGEVAVSCGKTSWYSEENFLLAKQLATAYGDRDRPLSIGTSNSSIKDSQTSPYQTITVGIDNAAALFYRTSPESSWIYVTSTQDAPSCDEFDEDAKRAFAGTTCYDYSTNSEMTL